MSIFSNFLKSVQIVHPTHYNFKTDSNKDYDPNNMDDKITTLITCQKILAESISKLPIHIYKNDDSGKIKDKSHPLYKILHQNPNSYQTSNSFFSTLEFQRNKYGNAFALINRKGGRVDNFEIIHPEDVVGYKIEAGNLYYNILYNGKNRTINAYEILHFKTVSEDGIFGLPLERLLIKEAENIYQGKTFLNNSYKKNLNVDKVIETTLSNFQNDKTKEQIKELKENYIGNQQGTPILPAGFKMVPMSRGNIQDAQILESLNLSKADIASLYGIPFHLILTANSTNSNIEQQSLNFKSNTIAPIARSYRQELEHKLLFDADYNSNTTIEFELKAMVETDITSRSNYYKAMHSMGAINSNDIAKLEGFETFEGGDKHFIQSQYIPIENYSDYAKAKAGDIIKEQQDEQDKE